MALSSAYRPELQGLYQGRCPYGAYIFIFLLKGQPLLFIHSLIKTSLNSPALMERLETTGQVGQDYRLLEHVLPNADKNGMQMRNPTEKDRAS